MSITISKEEYEGMVNKIKEAKIDCKTANNRLYRQKYVRTEKGRKVSRKSSKVYYCKPPSAPLFARVRAVVYGLFPWLVFVYVLSESYTPSFAWPHTHRIPPYELLQFSGIPRGLVSGSMPQLSWLLLQDAW